MPRYIADRPCFIGDVLRPEGVPFSVLKPVLPKPKWLKELKLTKKQREAIAAEQEAAAEQALLDNEDIEQVTGGIDSTAANPDFLNGEEDKPDSPAEDTRSPQQKAADTRAANKAAKEAAAEAGDTPASGEIETK